MRYILFLIIFLINSLLPSSYITSQETINQNIDLLIKRSEEIIFTNPEQATYYASTAIKSLSENDIFSKDNNLRARAIIAYAHGEMLLGNFDSSIEMLYEGLEIFTPTDYTLRGKIQSLMSVIYCRLEDYSTAIKLNDEATNTFKTVGDSILLANSYNNRGIIHYSLKEFNIAEQFFLQALNINRSLKHMKGISANLNNISLYEGNTEEKISFLNEAIVINKNLNAHWSLGENYNNLGKQYFYAKKYDKALEVLKTAYDISIDIGARELVCDYYEYSSWVYAELGDYKKSYEALTNLFRLNQELQSNTKLRNIEQDISNKRYLYQKEIAENKAQRFKIELLKRNIFILLVSLLLIIAVIMFLVKWDRKKKHLQLVQANYKLEQSEREIAELAIKKHEYELEIIQKALSHKRRENITFGIFLQSRNELLERIRNMIREGYKIKGDDINKHLKSINIYISQFQSTDIDNNNLLLNIEEKNKEFQDKLYKEHPDLTRGETELALLLSIKLSTKEISLLTGRSPKTVNMNRYRLRKSLNLSSDESLTEYLNNI